MRASLNGHSQFVHTLGSPKTIAPEQIRGAWGRCAGRRVRVRRGAVRAAHRPAGLQRGIGGRCGGVAPHRRATRFRPSTPRRADGSPRDLDRFVLSLLNKDPTRRPRDAGAVLEALRTVGQGPDCPPTRSNHHGRGTQARVTPLLATPEDESRALRAGKRCLAEGADRGPRRPGLRMAADQLGRTGSMRSPRRQKETYFSRGPHLRERQREGRRRRGVHAASRHSMPTDDIAANALMQADEGARQVRRSGRDAPRPVRGGGQSRRKGPRDGGDRATFTRPNSRTRAGARRVHQAFCDDPETDVLRRRGRALGRQRRRGLGTRPPQLRPRRARGDMPREPNCRSFSRLGRWYSEKLGPSDLAVACYQAILAHQAEPRSRPCRPLRAFTRRRSSGRSWPRCSCIEPARRPASRWPETCSPKPRSSTKTSSTTRAERASSTKKCSTRIRPT